MSSYYRKTSTVFFCRHLMSTVFFCKYLLSDPLDYINIYFFSSVYAKYIFRLLYRYPLLWFVFREYVCLLLRNLVFLTSAAFTSLKILTIILCGDLHRCLLWPVICSMASSILAAERLSLPVFIPE